jgi:hypothetical protein
MTGWHESELSPHVSQLRSGQTIDKRLPVASYPLVIYRKKVKRGAKAKRYLFRPGSLHDLGRHAVQCHGATPHNIGRINLHGMMGRVHHGSIALRMSLPFGMFVVSLGCAERFSGIPAERSMEWNV